MSKHPSGMPMLAKRLSDLEVTRREPDIDPSLDVRLPASIVADLGGFNLQGLATPCLLFLRSTARDAFNAAGDLARRLSTPSCAVQVAYSMKTNPDSRLLQLAHEAGLLVEAISQLEASRALWTGFASDRVVLNGPGKWWPSLGGSVEPLHAVFCDSLDDLVQICSREDVGSITETIGVRLRPPGVHSRFGVPVESFAHFEQLVSLVQRLPPDCRLGVHFHIASSVVGVPRWWHLLESTIAWAKAVEDASGKHVSCLDVGGGWFPDDWSATLRSNLSKALVNARDMLVHLEEVLLEPGKALAQSSFALALRVLQIRAGREGAREAVVDASVAELPDVQSYPHRIVVWSSTTKEWRVLGRGADSLVGRLCMEGDVIGHAVKLPSQLSEGDVLIVCDAGAYDRSMSYVFGRG